MQSYVSYRKFVSLGNGTRIMFRFLNGQDREGFSRLFQEAPEEEVRCMKEDFKDPGVVHHWLDHMDYRRVLPLAAVDLKANRLIACAHLHKGKHARRHIGDIRIYVSEPYRHVGLGSVMLEELIKLSFQENLRWLQAEVVAEHKAVIRAFAAKGFQIKAILEDCFLRQDGGTQHVALLLRPVLKEENAEF